MAQWTRFPNVYKGAGAGAAAGAAGAGMAGTDVVANGIAERTIPYQGNLSRLEAAIFDAVQLKLSPNNSELWAKQLQAVNKIHRSPDGREVNFVMRNGKADFPRELCFTRSDEFKVGVVDLKAKLSESKLRARVWCVGGHVFSIEYKTPFTVFEQAAQGE